MNPTQAGTPARSPAHAPQNGSPARFRVALASLCLMLLAVYLLAYAGRFHVIDEVSIYAMGESLAQRGSLDTNQIVWSQWVRPPREVQGDFGPDGSVYSKKGFAPALLPAALIRLAGTRPDWGLTYAALLANPLLTALAATLLAAYAARLGYRKRTGLLLGATYGLATLAFPYSRTLFGEPLAALALLMTAYALHASGACERDETPGRSMAWVGLAAVAFSVGLWVRSTSAPLALLFAWYAWRQSARVRPALLFLAGVGLVGLGGYAWYNAYRFGAPWLAGYQFSQGESFTTPPWLGAYGLLLSPFRGLLWFSPVLGAAVPALVLRRAWRTETWLALGVSAWYVAVYSGWWMWWAGFAWGPRFLLPAVPFLLLLTAWLWEHATGLRVMLGLGAVSLVVQLLAVASDFTLTETVLENTFGHPEQSRAMFDPLWSPIWLQARHLAAGFWDLAWVSIGKPALPVIAGCLLTLATAGFALYLSRHRQRAGAGLLLVSLVALSGAVIETMNVASAHGRSGDMGAAAAQAAAVLDRQAGPGDAVVTLAPYDYTDIMNWLHSPLPVVGLAPHPAPLRPEEEKLLSQALQAPGGSVWLLAARLAPGAGEAYVERWLLERGYLAYQGSFGDLRLVRFANPAPPSHDAKVEANFGGFISLDRVTFAGLPLAPGRPLRILLAWRATAAVPANYTVFVHLLAADGHMLAGQDGMPMNGYCPTANWQAGDGADDRKAILVPPEASPGSYVIEAGLYDSATGKRLPLAGAAGQADSIRVPVPLQ